jgi:hypothetical protein
VSALVGYKHSLMKTLNFLAALGSLVWLVLGLQWFRGTRNVPVLKDFRKPGRKNRYPSLSVILAARDEERWVNESIAFILAQDYPGMLEVIAVNDRSPQSPEKSRKMGCLLLGCACAEAQAG